MNKLAITLLLLVPMLSSFGQNFEFSTSHTALHVKDVNKSASFYQSVFGLEEVDTPDGMPKTIRWFVLADQAELHLIQSEDRVEIPKGIHISFATPKLEKFISHLTSKNIPFENWWGSSNTTNTRGDGVQQIYLQDLDGYWIEINDDID